MGTLHYVREGQLCTWVRIVETLFGGPEFEFGTLPSTKPPAEQQPPAAATDHTAVPLFPEHS